MPQQLFNKTYKQSTFCVLFVLLMSNSGMITLTLLTKTLSPINILLWLFFNSSVWVLYRHFKKLQEFQQAQIDLLMESSPVGITCRLDNEKYANKYFHTIFKENADAELNADTGQGAINEYPSKTNPKELKTENSQRGIVQSDGSIKLIDVVTSSAPLDRKKFIEISTFSEGNETETTFKEHQMRFMIETSPVGFSWYSFHKDPSGKTVTKHYVNDAHLSITGLTREESKSSKSYDSITPTEDLEKQAIVTNPIHEKKTNVVSMEKRYLHKDGSTRWVISTWTRRWDPNGCGFEEVGTITDITQEKKATEALQMKEAQLRFIFENSPFGLLWSDTKISDTEQGVSFSNRLINHAHMKITGLTYEESNEPGIFSKMTHPDDLSAQRQGISENLNKEDGSFSMEKRYIRKDGSIVWVSITWLRRWNEERTGFQELSTLVDITQRKRDEAEIRQARFQAELANNAKSQFLSTMSHEIRTPMNGLVGVLHIMENLPANEYGKYLEIAHRSANTLMTLINDILDFSKIESGKVDFEKRNFPINTTIENVAKLHMSAAASKNLNLYCHVHPSAAITFCSDEHRIQQVLSNLLNNAIKFTTKGKIEIGAKCTDDGRSLELFVNDTGIGISYEERTSLFQAFSQVNASTTRKYAGTGLGLSICKSIIEKMGGSIGLESALGKGSRFWIHLPLTQGSTPLEELLNTAPNIYSKQALLIEDDPHLSQNLITWLTQWKCKVTHVNRPSKAIEYIQETSSKTDYDFVLINSLHLKQLSKEGLFQHASLLNAKALLLDRSTESKFKPLPDHINARIKAPLEIAQLKEEIENSGIEEDLIEVDRKFSTTDLSRFLVLLVDDNPINRLVTAKLLSQKHNIAADSVNDGKEALEMLKSQKYDLILMDCMMPEMDGYEATKAIRAGKGGAQNTNISIIALTANAMEGNREKCLNSGMNDHLSKPIQPHSLKRALRAWLEKNQTQ